MKDKAFERFEHHELDIEPRGPLRRLLVSVIVVRLPQAAQLVLRLSAT